MKRIRAKDLCTALNFKLHTTICKGSFATACAQVNIDIKITPNGNLNLFVALPRVPFPADRYRGTTLLSIFNCYVGIQILWVAFVRYVGELGPDAYEGSVLFRNRSRGASFTRGRRVLRHVGYVLPSARSLVTVFSVQSVTVGLHALRQS